MASESPKTAYRDGIREIALNLFTVEVSTIVKAGMTARKMPAVPIALIDVIGTYYRFLSGLDHRYAVTEKLDSGLGPYAPRPRGGDLGPAAAKSAPDPAAWDLAVFRSDTADLTESQARSGGAPLAAKARGTGPTEADPDWGERTAALLRDYWDPQTGCLGDLDRRCNSSGSFAALCAIARLFRNYLLWLDRQKAHPDSPDPAPHIDAQQIDEDLIVCERVFQHSAILKGYVAGFETAAGLDPQSASAACLGGPDGSAPDDRHPWCKRWAWFTERADRLDLAAAVQVSASHITQIRKIWDTGTETVVMQTLVQMDGDIITRVHPRYADAAAARLHQLHNEATRTAIETWKDMALLVASLVGSTFQGLADLLLGRRG